MHIHGEVLIAALYMDVVAVVKVVCKYNIVIEECYEML